jgi:hypothetical protein
MHTEPGALRVCVLRSGGPDPLPMEVAWGCDGEF